MHDFASMTYNFNSDEAKDNDNLAKLSARHAFIWLDNCYIPTASVHFVNYHKFLLLYSKMFLNQSKQPSTISFQPIAFSFSHFTFSLSFYLSALAFISQPSADVPGCTLHLFKQNFKKI